MTDVRSSDRPPPPDLPCNVFVGLVTDYLEGALDDDDRARVEVHLAGCAGCRTVLEQWRTTIALTGRLGDEQVDEVDPATRAALLETFRHVRR